MADLRNYIESYNDFHTKGIVFRDVLGVLQETEIFSELISKMSSTKIIADSEAIIAIDARGFIFGPAISLHTSKPMLVDRKNGKLPGELIDKNYELEYGFDTLQVQKKGLDKYESFAIVDDVLATGGTASCVNEILKAYEKKVRGLVVVIEIESLDARKSLNIPVYSQIKY